MYLKNESQQQWQKLMQKILKLLSLTLLTRCNAHTMRFALQHCAMRRAKAKGHSCHRAASMHTVVVPMPTTTFQVFLVMNALGLT